MFAKTATKIGIVATKATFVIKKFLQTDVSTSFGYHSQPNIPTKGYGVFTKYNNNNVASTPDIQSEKNQNDKKNKKNDVDELIKLVENSQEILAEATTVFPMTLFPDTVTVDRTKVTIHRRRFFFTDEAFSLKIEDVLAVTCSIGPLFGSITIKIVMTGEDTSVNFFWRDDAIRIKHILQGYVIAKNSDVDTDSLSKDQLIAMVEKLGHDKNS
jgi:hypothetical protein